MFNLLSQNGKTSYGLCEYVCDTGHDIKKLPTDCAIGSSAFVIETGQTYILNRRQQWKILGENERVYGREEVALMLQDKENELLYDIENQLKEV